MRPPLTVSHAYLSFSYSCGKDTRQELEEPDILRIRFSNNHISKYILLLRKGVYPYEYKFNQTLPEKEKKISKINKENITDADYMHTKRVCRDFEIQNLGEYHDLFLKSDKLFLADVFGNFRKMCLKIYELDPEKFLSAPGVAWQAALKRLK